MRMHALEGRVYGIGVGGEGMWKAGTIAGDGLRSYLLLRLSRLLRLRSYLLWRAR